jgi:nucleolar pre-ribosomal-associated protein 1
LLEPTLLFDHDRSELDIWLSSLLYADPSISGPHLIIQQIHLLSFLDDCFRRAQKASYKYIEDLIALVPDTFSFSRPGEMISCVMMAMLEQLKAKILGQHIATDAAWVVLSYLRRVMLGLSGKIKDKKVIDAITGRLDEILKEAKEAGQDRKGLKAVVKGMRKDGKAVFTGATGVSKGGKDKEDKEDAGKDEPMLVDES